MTRSTLPGGEPSETRRRSRGDDGSLDDVAPPRRGLRGVLGSLLEDPVATSSGFLAPRPGSSLSGNLVAWVGIPGLVIVFLLLTAYGVERLANRRRSLAFQRALVEIVTVTVREHVRDAMLLGGSYQTARWLQGLSDLENVQEARIVSPAYRVSVAAPGGLVGQPVEDAWMRSVFGGKGVQVDRSGGGLRLVVPLVNERDCQACHAPSPPVLGAVDLRFPRVGPGGEMAGASFLAGTLLIVGVVGASALLVLKTADRYLVRPIRQLSAASRDLAAGRTEEPDLGPVPTEIRQLASDVVSMARQIREQGAVAARARRESDHVRVLAGIGEMAARVAHEVRNPLNAIEGAAFYLGNHLSGDEVAREYLGLIRTEVGRINAVASDLLSATRPVVPSLERFRLEELVRERSRLVELVQSERPDVDVVAPPGLPEIFADRRQLSQVLDNLLENAAQAAGAGGRIGVTVEAVEQSPLQQSLRLAVEDDGPGLSEEAREKLFTPFFTTKPQGTGLGLIIVRKIVSAHRGTFSLEDAPSGGVRAIVELPV